MSDLRSALRRLRRRPGFTATAILTLALGIGATVAVFSVVDHVLLEPLPISHSDRVVTICETNPRTSDYCSVATPNLVDWSRAGKAFEVMGAARTESMALRTSGGARGVSVGIAMPGFLRAVGAAVERGRMLEDQDGPPTGDGKVALVTSQFWQNELGGEKDIIGRTLILDGERYVVIGVLSAESVVPRLDYAGLWVPLPWDPATPENRDWRGFVAAARLKPGFTVEEAQSELRSTESALATIHPEALDGWSVDVQRMRDYVVRGSRAPLFTFLAAVGLVLLLVCANISSLMLAHATSMQREMAVRFALGAGRRRLMRQHLADSLLLSLIGGGGGVLVAIWGVRLFRLLAPPGIPRLNEISVDARALLVTLGISVSAGLVMGLVPAIRIRELRLGEIFRGGRSPSVDRSTHRFRRWLVVGQLALGLVLVSSAGLLLHSFNNLLGWQPGFDTDHLVTFWTVASPGKYPQAAQALDVYRRISMALEAQPGVRAVGTVSAGPLFGGGDGLTPFLIAGRGWRRDAAPGVAWYDAGPNYFPTLGLPLLRGRLFEESDRADGPTVVVINQAMARHYWQDQNPIGSTISFPELDGAPAARVIGVVADIKPFLPEHEAPAEVYFSNRQRTRWATYFVVRTDGDTAALLPAIRRNLQGIDPDLEASQLGTMEDHIGAELARPRFEMLLVTVFAVLALLLALIGIYGLVAYSTQARSGEIAVRLALGASPRGILWWTLADVGAMVSVGTLIGLAGTYLFAKLLAGTIHGLSQHDPLTLISAASVLVLGALVASIRPARRAARVDPMEMLRHE